MYCKIVIATLAVFVGYDYVSAQHIPPTTTAAELWNPWTWFWPYAKATAEGYAEYYDKAQKATNELYQQIYKTNAFPWITGDWSFLSQNNQGGSGKPNNAQNQGGSGKPNNAQNQEGNGTQNNTQSQGGNSGQASQGGNSGQAGQGSNTQSNQENSQTTQEQNKPKPAENESGNNSGTGAQVQGNVQDDGTADASANAKVEDEEVNV